MSLQFLLLISMNLELLDDIIYIYYIILGNKQLIQVWNEVHSNSVFKVLELLSIALYILEITTCYCTMYMS